MRQSAVMVHATAVYVFATATGRRSKALTENPFPIIQARHYQGLKSSHSNTIRFSCFALQPECYSDRAPTGRKHPSPTAK